MKKYKLRKIMQGLPVLLAMLAAFCTYSCRDEDNPDEAGGKNLTLDFTRAGEVQTAIVPNMRIFSFYPTGAANADRYYREVLNLTRNASAGLVTAQVDAGTWNLALVAPPAGVSLIAPTAGLVADNMPLYTYAPAYNSTLNKSEDSPEIYLAKHDQVAIAANTAQYLTTRMDRNMARVQVVIEKSTSNFNMLSTDHELELSNVPATISYTGKLLPSKTAPAVTGSPLTSKITMKNHATLTGYMCSDTVTFIIPAHRGSDYDLGLAAVDTTTRTMDLKLKLRRTGGTDFEETITIPRVARCSGTLRVMLTVNDGILVKTEVMPWYEVGRSSTVGPAYANYLYVKKGSTGSGSSWSDAAPGINAATTRAEALIAASKTVHGILVAGGSAYVYDEYFTIPAGVRIFGGWEGTPGTELSATDADAPFTSTDRNLKTYKARISYNSSDASHYIDVSAANTLLDGFLFGGCNVQSLIVADGPTSAVNAVEITYNTAANELIRLDNGAIASNVLISGSTGPVYVRYASKMINCTLANNTSYINRDQGMILNSVFWNNSGQTGTVASVMHSAFVTSLVGTLPGAGNIHLNAGNTAWFSTTNDAPGPHFDAGATGGKGYYEALNDRSPLIGRGSQALFDDNTPYLPAGYKKDIDGNDRHISNSNIVTAVTDIGCYESDSSAKGFFLSWATDRIYVSYKAAYTSQYPLMLPNNNTYGIGVSWTATVSSLNYTSMTSGGSTVTTTTGGGTGVVVVGAINFLNNGVITPDDDYTGSADRQCGSIAITTNLGNYLPNTNLEVWQTSGDEEKWFDSYVGSFHRNSEVGARYITGTNTGAWTARVISGLDWIKIDKQAKNYGTAITDSDEGTPPAGGDTYYREVEQVWSGLVSGTGNVQFRVGMQSKNTTGAPRYGLIIITRGTKISLFFVRQGEDADYLYRSVDRKPNSNPRTQLVKISPYNLRDPGTIASTNGINLPKGGSVFVDYPTKAGDYFKWNQTTAYRHGVATTLSTTVLPSWEDAREICPSGYRHPSHVEFINSLYYNQATPAVVNAAAMLINPLGIDATRNALWGAYADGYFDQLVSNPVGAAIGLSVGSGVNRAVKGTLMVNHYNYSSVFYPGGSAMKSDGTLRFSSGSEEYTGFALYYTSTYHDGWYDGGVYGNRGSNAHWQGAHIGMNCTQVNKTEAATTRCVKE